MAGVGIRTDRTRSEILRFLRAGTLSMQQAIMSQVLELCGFCVLCESSQHGGIGHLTAYSGIVRFLRILREGVSIQNRHWPILRFLIRSSGTGNGIVIPFANQKPSSVVPLPEFVLLSASSDAMPSHSDFQTLCTEGPEFRFGAPHSHNSMVPVPATPFVPFSSMDSGRQSSRYSKSSDDEMIILSGLVAVMWYHIVSRGRR